MRRLYLDDLSCNNEVERGVAGCGVITTAEISTTLASRTTMRAAATRTRRAASRHPLWPTAKQKSKIISSDKGRILER